MFERTVFRAGTEGYHTFRIPAIVRGQDGTLLAFCEGRRHSARDDGDIDLVLKRSTDHGTTWSPLSVIGDEREHTIGNPAPVVDRRTGRIFCLFCRDNERVFVIHSDDHGATWSQRRELTQDVKRVTWSWYATGPGHAIQLARGEHAGRLIVGCDHRDLGAHGWNTAASGCAPPMPPSPAVKIHRPVRSPP